MTPKPRISWDTFAEIIADADAPVVVRLDGPAVVHLFFEPGAGRLGLRLPAGSAELDPSPLAQIEISTRRLQGEDVIEIATRVAPLFPYFHGFATSVADRVQLDAFDANAAVNECVSRWRDLLRQAASLSPERQLGLVGELWLLGHLVGRLGSADALAASTGPTRAAHDFRFDQYEIEVKTTRNEHRIHMISTDTQLVASEGCDLYLLSIQVAVAGPGQGMSLGSRVVAIRELLGDPTLIHAFDELLAHAYGLDPLDLGQYSARVKLRTEPYLVPVDKGFPRLVLHDLVNADAAARISEVQYRVDVEGLGFPAGSVQFDSILGDPDDVAG